MDPRGLQWYRVIDGGKGQVSAELLNFIIALSKSRC